VSTPQPSHMATAEEQKVKDSIDNYEQTILAMVGFMNFYSRDATNKAVHAFQARRLTSVPLPPPESKEDEDQAPGPVPFQELSVTPDIGILQSNNHGVLAEVKITLPRDQTHWQDFVDQLIKYDQPLKGWPVDGELVENHDIVLLVHRTRSRAVKDFLAKANEKGFSRPFSIVEVNKQDQAKEYLYFRKEDGVLSDPAIDQALYEGKAVPLQIILKLYSSIKISDDKPEVPYLMNLIWTHVVTERVSRDPKFPNLTKRSSLRVEVALADIQKELFEGYSFAPYHRAIPRRQSKYPLPEWILEACQRFVDYDEAVWSGTSREAITFIFRKYDDVLAHWIDQFLGGQNPSQHSLFDGEEAQA